MPDQADIHRKCSNKKAEERRKGIVLLGDHFSDLHDKAQAWQDLVRLIPDGDPNVRMGALDALGSAFSHVPDKAQAWQDLYRLTQDNDSWVRGSAAEALGSAFSYAPDKPHAWQDLHRLTQEKDGGVQIGAAKAIGSAFSHILDRNQAWQDLHRLTQENNSNVRMHAFHSLGRASVVKATEEHDNDTLKKELEVAITYFEKSSRESTFSPARFCYPFYRSYFAVTFQGAKEDDVQRYLAEAKEAVGGSKSKDDLLKVIENLAGALRESQCLKDIPFQDVASKLNVYRWYCEKAANYMVAVQDKAPGAVKLMQKCNPLLEERIQTTIAEIQEKARLIGPEIEGDARCLSLGDPVKVYQCSMRMASTLRVLCRRLPEEMKQSIQDLLAGIEKDEDLSDVLGKIELAMAYTLPVIESERSEVLDRLKNIEFSMAKLNLSSGSARQDLYELKTIIQNFQDRTKARGFSKEELSTILQERDNTLIERLDKLKEDWLLSMEEMAEILPSCKATDEILREIQGLKQSRRRDLLGITGDISSIAGLFAGLIGLAVTMKPA